MSEPKSDTDDITDVDADAGTDVGTDVGTDADAGGEADADAGTGTGAGADAAQADVRGGSDASAIFTALLIAVSGLCVIPISQLTRAYSEGNWDAATAALTASVLPILIVTAAAVTRATRVILLVTSGLVVLHIAGLLVLAETASVAPLSNTAFGSPLAQLGCAVVGLGIAWWDRSRAAPRSWPALVPVVLGPVVGVLIEAPPWSEPWGPISTATVVGGRGWIVAAVIAAGLVCYPRHRVRFGGVVFTVLAGLHVAFLLTRDPGSDVADLALMPESMTARSVLFAALVSAVVWGLAAAAPPRRTAGVVDEEPEPEAAAEDRDQGANPGKPGSDAAAEEPET